MEARLVDVVSIDDLSEDMKMIAELCGMETAKALLQYCSGVQVYIPRLERIPGVMRKLIRERYGERPLTESEIKALAVEMRLSPSYLRKEFAGGG